MWTSFDPLDTGIHSLGPNGFGLLDGWGVLGAGDDGGGDTKCNEKIYILQNVHVIPSRLKLLP